MAIAASGCREDCCPGYRIADRNRLRRDLDRGRLWSRLTEFTPSPVRPIRRAHQDNRRNHRNHAENSEHPGEKQADSHVLDLRDLNLGGKLARYSVLDAIPFECQRSAEGGGLSDEDSLTRNESQLCQVTKKI